MKKNIAIELQIVTADGVDVLDHYTAYKAGVMALLAASSLRTRHFARYPRPEGGETVSIISDVVVDNALDFNDQFEAFRAAVATAFEVGEFDVSVLTSGEGEIPE